MAGTSELPHKLDDLQMKYDEGPCVQAAIDDLIVRTEDFRNEERWPRYSPAAVELGVLSGLSVKLYTADRTAGALNLFAFKPNAFDGEDETIATVLAAHAAAAILASRQGEQLQSALTTRDRIGQAKGIIMERYGIDDVAAFEMLKRLSQDSNVRLADIAQQVIDTRSSRWRAATPNRRSLHDMFRENGLLLACVGLFAVFFVGMIVSGTATYNEEQLEHGSPNNSRCCSTWRPGTSSRRRSRIGNQNFFRWGCTSS